VALGPLKEEVVREYKEKTRMRREIIRRLWRLLDLVEGRRRCWKGWKSWRRR